MATESFKLQSERRFGVIEHGYRLLYSVVAVITLSLVLERHDRTNIITMPRPAWVVAFVGVPGLLLGITIVRVCLSKYFVKLSGVAVFMDQSSAPGLDTEGIHSYCRHPLYLGTIITIWSVLLLFPDVRGLISCVAVTIYVVVGIRPEEAKLMKQFGAAYTLYSQKTPALLPRFSFHR